MVDHAIKEVIVNVQKVIQTREVELKVSITSD